MYVVAAFHRRGQEFRQSRVRDKRTAFKDMEIADVLIHLVA